jgi:hypothetical protein
MRHVSVISCFTLLHKTRYGIEHHLSKEPEQSDVLHDLLAFLAEEMMRLNKEKRAAQKEFLDGLVTTARVLPGKDGRKGTQPRLDIEVKGVQQQQATELLADLVEGELAARLPCCGESAELLEQTQQIVVRVVADNHPVADLVHLANLEPH